MSLINGRWWWYEHFHKQRKMMTYHNAYSKKHGLKHSFTKSELAKATRKANQAYEDYRAIGGTKKKLN